MGQTEIITHQIIVDVMNWFEKIHIFCLRSVALLHFPRHCDKFKIKVNASFLIELNCRAVSARWTSVPFLVSLQVISIPRPLHGPERDSFIQRL